MKSLYPLTLALSLTGCVSFKPVSIDHIDNFTAAGCPTDICTARKYALDATKKYKNAIYENYDKNNKYDSWILNLVTIGVGAEVANLHSDVVKTAAMGLGYQTARKTYESIPFQLQIYTGAIGATQCVYNASADLEVGQGQLANLKAIAATLRQSINALKINKTSAQTLITKDIPELGSYAEMMAQLERALARANEAYDVLNYGNITISSAIESIDTTVLLRFNGQMPNINEISKSIKGQVEANLALENDSISEVPTDTASTLLSSLTSAKAAGTHTAQPQDVAKKPLFDGLQAMNSLAALRVERYITAANTVSACGASL